MRELIENKIIECKNSGLFNSGDDFLLLYVLKGRLTCKRSFMLEAIEEGQMLFINRQEVCCMSAAEKCIVQVIRIDGKRCVLFFPEMEEICFESTTLRWEDTKDEFNHGRDKIFLSNCINHFYEAASDTLSEQGRFILSLLCLEYDCMNDRQGNYSYVSVEKKRRMKRILKYVRDHIREKVSLQQAAQAEKITPQYLTSVWKECFSVSFMNYVSELRLKNIELRLFFSDDLIQRVIFEEGFADSRHFYQCFHKTYGCSPSQWKKRWSDVKADYRVLPFEEASFYLEQIRAQKHLFVKPMDSILYRKYRQIKRLKEDRVDLENCVIQICPYDTYEMNKEGITPLFMFGYDLLMREIFIDSLQLNIVIPMKIFEEQFFEGNYVDIQDVVIQSIIRFGKVSLSKWSLELKCRNEKELKNAFLLKKILNEKGVADIKVVL